MESKKTTVVEVEPDANRDPITGAPGAHPVGVGVGATGGAAAGAAIGSLGGPVGTVVGAAIGGIAGGLAGKGAAEVVNPTVEDAHWRSTYPSRPYADTAKDYDTYAPAYRYGWESRSRYGNRPFNEIEGDLERGWDRVKGDSKLAWNQAKLATKDAWHRIEYALPGDADNDGR